MKTQKYFLRFPKCETEKPLVYQLVKEYGLIVNIFSARVTRDQEGFLVLDITGEEADVNRGLDYIRSYGVIIDNVDCGILFDTERCTGCGNCVSHCPTQALHIADRKTMRVELNKELCIACGICVDNCPFGACTAVC